MGYPRYLTVPPGAQGIYHCVSRCVRRAFLCGEDPVSGRTFDHRKRWLEDRILALAEIFAVAIHAYAVMSNHVHVVLEIDPAAPGRWSDEEVARRWLSLSGFGRDDAESRVAALCQQAERLSLLRERLGSLSWYMRYLKEPVARRANREDGCTGRFWEGRFNTQDLLDDEALLTCMTYVDLNPVRAGVARTPDDTRHTSLVRRRKAGLPSAGALRPVASSIDAHALALDAAQYAALVTWTSECMHGPQPGASIANAPMALRTTGMRPRQWLMQVRETESGFLRAIGCVDRLLEHARCAGRRWLRGIGTARALQNLPEEA